MVATISMIFSDPIHAFTFLGDALEGGGQPRVGRPPRCALPPPLPPLYTSFYGGRP